MTTFITSVNKYIVAVVVGLVVFGMSAPAAFAQTYYYPITYTTPYTYNYSYSNAAQVQALVNQINALMVQLQQMQGYTSNANYHKYYFNNGTPKQKTYTYNYGSNRYDIDVETKSYDVEDDETVTLFGSIDLDGASYADVWFEYGTDGDLDEESDEERVTRDGTFSIEVDNLDEDEQYYYRAVAEDSSGSRDYGTIKAFDLDGNDDDDNDDEDTPEARTEDAEDIDDDSAELHGSVDMNDFEDGRVFFVYGEDEGAVEDVEDENRYSDIDEDGDDLHKVLLSSSLDDERSFWARVYNLDSDTDHYFRICVEYEDEDGDDTLECGDIEEFTTND